MDLVAIHLDINELDIVLSALEEEIEKSQRTLETEGLGPSTTMYHEDLLFKLHTIHYKFNESYQNKVAIRDKCRKEILSGKQ